MSQDLVLLNQLQSDISNLVAPFSEFKITSLMDAQSGVNALKEVKQLKERIENTRKILVDPLNTRVKAINDFAKQISQPILSAEVTVKQSLISFEKEQEKIRNDARAKIKEEANQKADELRIKQESELSATKEVAEIFGTDEKHEQLINDKHLHEQSAAFNERQNALYEIEENKLKNIRKTWKCELIDMNLVPMDYVIKTLNEKAVLAMARAGKTDIPGVRVWQETSLAVGANTYIPSIQSRSDGLSYKGNEK